MRCKKYMLDTLCINSRMLGMAFILCILYNSSPGVILYLRGLCETLKYCRRHLNFSLSYSHLNHASPLDIYIRINDVITPHHLIYQKVINHQSELCIRRDCDKLKHLS